MATATATAPSAAAQGSTLVPRFKAVEQMMDDNNVERKEEIELILLSVLGGVDVLFLGDPGVGKTYMLELFTNHGLVNAALFNHMIFKEAGVEELIGPRSIAGLKNDEIRRITNGYLPEADTAILDEIFKGSPAVLNAMLDIFANRILKVGGQTIDCSQLQTILMASNELPDREDLNPFRDRIGITKMVEPVKTPEGRKRVAKIQLGQIAGGVTTEVEPLALADVQTARGEVDAIKVPDPIIDMMCDAQQKWLEAGHPPSQRRMKQMWKVVKAHAWLAGRAEATADDLVPCQHMAFNLLEHAASAREVILEYASAFTRKAERLRQSLEPVLVAAEELKQKIEAAESTEDQEALMDSGVKFIRQLRTLRKEGESQLKEGTAQGQDVSSLTTVLDEITRSETWAKTALTGTED